MANKRVESIHDLIHWRLDLTVQCRRCGRLACFDANDVAAWLNARRLANNYPPPIKLRCVCGSRDHRFGFVDMRMRPVPLPTRKVGLVAIYVQKAG